MSNRLRLTTILCAALSVSGMLAACDDGGDAVPNGEENGGAAGESPATAGKQTGGSSSGSAGTAGGGTAGKAGGAGAGGADMAGEGGGGAGGEPSIGGAGGEPSIGGAGGAAGAAGAGGGGPELEYLCGAATLSEKLCSALVSVTCDEPTICVECIPAREGDLELFAECPACLALHEAAYQCAIDAYEGGNTAAGIECFGVADINDACFESFNQAIACNDYKNAHGDVCPATWPLP